MSFCLERKEPAREAPVLPLIRKGIVSVMQSETGKPEQNSQRGEDGWDHFRRITVIITTPSGSSAVFDSLQRALQNPNVHSEEDIRSSGLKSARPGWEIPRVPHLHSLLLFYAWESATQTPDLKNGWWSCGQDPSSSIQGSWLWFRLTE